MQGQLVSWCFEPSQPLGIIIRAECIQSRLLFYMTFGRLTWSNYGQCLITDGPFPPTLFTVHCDTPTRNTTIYQLFTASFMNILINEPNEKNRETETGRD